MAKWSIPMSRFTGAAARRLDLVVRKATFEAFGSAVRRSPVDTGRFRANWNVSSNEVDTSTTDMTSQARADAELRKALAFKSGGIVYLTNSLPYAARLEDGWSKQAPTGMVRVTAVEWSNKLAQVIKNL